MKERKRVQLDCSNDKCITEQSHRDRVDINGVVRQYAQTGVMPPGNRPIAQPENYIDLANLAPVDLQSAMDIVANANSAFERLPSSERARFKNDPRLYLEEHNRIVAKHAERKKAEREEARKNPRRRDIDKPRNRRSTDKEKPAELAK